MSRFRFCLFTEGGECRRRTCAASKDCTLRHSQEPSAQPYAIVIKVADEPKADPLTDGSEGAE